MLHISYACTCAHDLSVSFPVDRAELCRVCIQSVETCMVFSELFAGVISHVVVFAESVSRVLRRVYTFASPSVWVNEIESFSL